MSSKDLFGEEIVEPAPRSGAGGSSARDASGAPRLRTADRRQIELRPFDLESLLPPEHRARTVWSAVERLDLSGFHAAIRARGSEPGRSATDPAILVCLWLFATSEAVGSARELERLCKEHDAYRWICGGVSMNHHTLSDFRVGHGKALDDLMTQVLAVLLRKKLVRLERTAQDGMRIRASAGAASFRREPSLKACLAEAEAQVRRLKAEVASPIPGTRTRQQAAAERAARERKERIEEALAELPKARAVKDKKDQEKARVSTTDAEARVMKMGDGGFRPAYNVQLATDVDSRVVVGVKVTNAGGDAAQMTPMLDDIERRTSTRPVEHLVDGGFVNLEAFTRAADGGTTVFAPVPTPRTEGIDPHAPKPNDSEAVAAWRQRMATPEAKEVYKERAATAETVNADLRVHRGLDRLNVRGIDKVLSVTLWAALSYNILRAVGLAAWS